MLAIPLLAGCDKFVPVTNQEPTITTTCADIVLRPGTARSDVREIGLTRDAVPNVRVMAVSSRATRRELLVRPCSGDEFVPVEIDAAGVSAQATFGRAIGSETCIELLGRAFINDTLDGIDRTILRRGPGRIDGLVRDANGAVVADAAVRVQLGADTLHACSNAQGRFAMTGLSPGVIAFAEASAIAKNGARMEAVLTPKTELSATSTRAELTFELTPAIVVRDSFEPDDTVELASHRTPALVGSKEAHTLAPQDVDIVPIELSAAARVVIRLQPDVSGIDASLRVTRARDGLEVAHANGPGDAFQAAPKVTLTAPEAGKYFITVSRNDGESVTLPYDLIVAPSGS